MKQAIAVCIAVAIMTLAAALPVAAQNIGPAAPNQEGWRQVQYQQQFSVRNPNYRAAQQRRAGPQ